MNTTADDVNHLIHFVILTKLHVIDMISHGAPGPSDRNPGRQAHTLVNPELLMLHVFL